MTAQDSGRVRGNAGGGQQDDRHIVASPHANHEFDFHPDVVARKIEELQAAVNGTIRIHSGCDFHLSFDNIQDSLRSPAKYAINHGRYILVEFSDLLIPKTTDDVFYHMQSAGMIPIITHPERNMLLQKRLEKIESWVENGCLLQVTALSFLGRFGKHAKAFADTLLRKGLAHIVASDAHDTRFRPPSLKEAYHYVAEACGEPHAQLLFVTNPAATLIGTPVEKFGPAPEPQKSWLRFWR